MVLSGAKEEGEHRTSYVERGRSKCKRKIVFCENVGISISAGDLLVREVIFGGIFERPVPQFPY